MHAVRKQRIVNLTHTHAGALLDAFDGGFRRQAAVDGLVNAAAPAFVICKHLIGRDDLFMFAARAEINLARHAVDLFAHFVKGGIDAVTLGFDILRDGVFNADIGLVKNGNAGSSAFYERQARKANGACVIPTPGAGFVDKVCIGDQF